jgi:type IV pilus assembly protein PilA
MRKHQSGFTIIELMIAVAIIGVLAAIAVPAYSNYINRAKVSEALTFAATAKTAVAETYQSNGQFPTSNSQAGLPATITAPNVRNLTISDNGVITVTTSIANVSNGNITLSPSVTSAGLTWLCTSETAVSNPNMVL